MPSIGVPSSPHCLAYSQSRAEQIRASASLVRWIKLSSTAAWPSSSRQAITSIRLRRKLAQDALERLFITHRGEQGGQIALVGGPALGLIQIPGGEQFGQQLRLFEEGVGDKIGETEQGQQGLANRLGQRAIVGGQLDQSLPLALGLFLQQGGEGGERGRVLGHGCRPCGSRQRVNDTRLTTLPVQNGGCQSSTVRPPRHSAGARSMIRWELLAASQSGALVDGRVVDLHQAVWTCWGRKAKTGIEAVSIRGGESETT